MANISDLLYIFYFQIQIRALSINHETYVFIRFLFSIKFSIIISHKKKGEKGGEESVKAPVTLNS